MRPPRWLVFSYFSGVDGMAASLHIDRLTAELRARGSECLVVTSPVASPGDPGKVRAPSLFPSGIRFELRHAFRRVRPPLLRSVVKPLSMLALAPFYFTERVLFPAEPAWSWSFAASWAGLRAARRFAPDVILSTCGPYSAHVAAARVSRLTGIPWIAEFRDPLIHEGAARGRLEGMVLSRVEATVAREAAAAVYFVERTRANAAARGPFRGVTRVIYPGAPPMDLSTRPPWKRGRTLRLVHLGTLSRTRNLAPVVGALDLLKGRSSPAFSDIEVLQCGYSDRGVRSQAESFPDRIRILDRVPHDEVEELMRSADVLLLIQDDDDFSAETIPSKVYEYLHAGRPVLGIVHRNPELSGMLRSLGHRSVPLRDNAALAAAMEDIHRDWSGPGLAHTGSPSPHTVASAADRFLALAGEVGRPRDQR